MVYCADGIPGAEALFAQKRLSVLLSYKLKGEYSEMYGFVARAAEEQAVRSHYR